MTAWWVTGDSLDVLRQMPDASVDVVVTSPPFLALRSYLPDDDPAKAQEIGQGGTPPGVYLDALLDITEELRRVLAPHGSICVELGDTYAGSGGAGGDYSEGGLRDGQQAFKGSSSRSRADGNGKVFRGGERMAGKRGDGWPVDKSLSLIPELYRIALVYGFNPLTGRTTPRWRARNVIRWTRPNPPVGELGDKFRPATSDMVIACGTDEAGRTRYFDLDAVRSEPAHGYTSTRSAPNYRPIPGQPDRKTNPVVAGERIECNPAGAPPLDWWEPTADELKAWDEWADQFDEQMWEIPTHPYKGAHHATFPPALVTKPIMAMCPQRVCTVCGEPSRRIVEANSTGQNIRKPGHPKDGSKQRGAVASTHVPSNADRVTLGWTDCGHDAWRPGRVLDPFGGSGTTGAVATGHGRDFIGLDLDARNADLARERIGMWFWEVSACELTELLEPTSIEPTLFDEGAA